MRKTAALLIASALFAPIFSGCEQEPLLPPAQTSCPANTAMISVADGYTQTLCGCAEPSPVYYSSGDRLLCTVTAGTTVIFHYIATRLRHQVIPTGTPTFPASPPSLPGDQISVFRVHAVKLETTGTYSFDDAYDSSLTGDIVVL